MKLKKLTGLIVRNHEMDIALWFLRESNVLNVILWKVQQQSVIPRRVFSTNEGAAKVHVKRKREWYSWQEHDICGIVIDRLLRMLSHQIVLYLVGYSEPPAESVNLAKMHRYVLYVNIPWY